MAGSYTISVNNDLPATGTTSIFAGQRGRTVPEGSRVQMFANREAVGVTVSVFGGTENQVDQMQPVLNSTVGAMPDTTNLIADFFLDGGEEIVVQGTNTTAGALELRVTAIVTPVDDNALKMAMDNLGVTQRSI